MSVRAQAALTAAQGGHSTGVQAMITTSQPLQFLISADWEGNMKVWLHDLLAPLKCAAPSMSGMSLGWPAA